MTDYPKSGIKMPGTIKAGCGIRFDPDDLTEDTGFDFSAAEALRPDGEKSVPEVSDADAPANETVPASPEPPQTP